jgi:hypothetical protein
MEILSFQAASKGTKKISPHRQTQRERRTTHVAVGELQRHGGSEEPWAGSLPYSLSGNANRAGSLRAERDDSLDRGTNGGVERAEVEDDGAKVDERRLQEEI